MNTARGKKRERRPRASIGRRYGAGVLLIAGVLATGALAAWMLLRGEGGDASRTPPLMGERIDASFAGLKDTHGLSVDEAALMPRYRLVTFGYTTCPDVCPLTLLGIHQALETLGPSARQIVPVFVSVDPEHDTAQALSAYVSAFDPRILALTGSPDALRRVAERYRAVFDRSRDPVSGANAVEHSAFVVLVDPGQRVRAVISSAQPPEQIAAGIVEAFRGSVRDAGARG
jgi:protein SCO1